LSATLTSAALPRAALVADAASIDGERPRRATACRRRQCCALRCWPYRDAWWTHLSRRHDNINGMALRARQGSMRDL